MQTDLENYLGLEPHSLGPPVHVIPGKKVNDHIQQQRDALKIDICDDQYAPIRNRYLPSSRNAARWILDYFVKSPSVYVSNPDHFRSLIESYAVDPCPARNAARGKGSSNGTTPSTRV